VCPTVHMDDTAVENGGTLEALHKKLIDCYGYEIVGRGEGI
jgi:hypothetical protein